MSYQFPVFRHGALYAIEQGLDASAAKAVADEVLSIWSRRDMQVEITSALASAGYSLSEAVTARGGSEPHIWEGWVARPPAYTCAVVDSSATAWSIDFRVSMVACLRPNKSKVWVRLLLTAVDGVAADNLSRDDVEAFYRNADLIGNSVSTVAASVYDSAVEAVTGSRAVPERAGSIGIRTVMCASAGLPPIADEIRAGNPFSLSKQFETAWGSDLMRDFFRFAIHEEIEDYKKYGSVMEGRRRQWHDADKKLLEGHEDSIIEAGGVQVFGLTYDACVALYARDEKLGCPNDIDCFGVVPVDDNCVGCSDGLPTSVKASMAMMETISPFI